MFFHINKKTIQYVKFSIRKKNFEIKKPNKKNKQSLHKL